MFQKTFRFGRRKSDEPRQRRFDRTTSQKSHNPSRSPSNVSTSIGERSAESIDSLPRTTAFQYSRTPSDPLRTKCETGPGPLGLNVVYTPEGAQSADIVFIHGLGGTSRRTWSKNEDPELFWPLKFLPLEPDISMTRIFTFGYNANYRRAGNISTSVLDFAKDLLFDLKYAKGEQQEDLIIGNVPLVFVVHSMGGLIIKEAYMQGQNDPKYETIIKAISAITFLATPHRGTNLAELLDKILRSTIVSNSKQYVSELAKNSFTLQKLNEQFRHIAPRLEIVSFYETQSTSIGIKNARVMILEKDSSVLGYPGETSKALNADHHNVCKYDSPKDPNYITVRNALKAIIGKIMSSGINKPIAFSQKQLQDLKSLLAITEIPDVDYIFFRDQWAQGTCKWLLEDEKYQEWLSAYDSGSSVLWLHGGAATGKSVLSSFIINDLVERGVSCQYFYVRFGDHGKRSLSLLLRSIAYQIAQTLPVFLHSMLKLVDESIDFASADPRTIWERVFKYVLFSIKKESPIYWVIDGLDEAVDPRALIRLLSDISSSSIPIRTLLVSRNTLEIADVFHKIPMALKPSSRSIEGHRDDLQSYIGQELRMPGPSQYKESIVRRILAGAQNNFLWLRLAVDRLNHCHTQADVELALGELPTGMEALYDRMAESIRQKPATDRALTTTILQFVTCSLRILTVAELSEAMHGAPLGFWISSVPLWIYVVALSWSTTVATSHSFIKLPANIY